MTPPSPTLGAVIAAFCCFLALMVAAVQLAAPPWTPFAEWAFPVLLFAGLAAAVLTWWRARS